MKTKYVSLVAQFVSPGLEPGEYEISFEGLKVGADGKSHVVLKVGPKLRPEVVSVDGAAT